MQYVSLATTSPPRVYADSAFGHAPVPSAYLSLGQVLSLVEKRLRWYGFDDWRIHDVVCDYDQSVAVQIRSSRDVVLTMHIARNCAVVRYAVHLPEGLQRADEPGSQPRRAPAEKPDRELTRAKSPHGDYNERAFVRGRAALNASLVGSRPDILPS